MTNEQVDMIRSRVRKLVEDSSLRVAARQVGVGVGSVRGLLDGRTPRAEALTKFETWATYGRSQPDEEVNSIWKTNEEIGEIIRKIREERGMSQAELAAHLGMPEGQAEVSRYEKGKRRPGYERLLFIAGLGGHGIEVFQTLGLVTSPPPESGPAGVTTSADTSSGDTSGLNLPDVSYLLPRARGLFNETILEYLQRGWTYETVEAAAVILVGYFTGSSTLRSSGVSLPELSEEMQIAVLEKAKEEIETAFRRRVGASRR